MWSFSSENVEKPCKLVRGAFAGAAVLGPIFGGLVGVLTGLADMDVLLFDHLRCAHERSQLGGGLRPQPIAGLPGVYDIQSVAEG